MKLLLDEHLSARLIELLTDLYPGSEQVLASGLGGAGDGVVWEYAKLRGLTMVSKVLDLFRPQCSGRRSAEDYLDTVGELLNERCREAAAFAIRDHSTVSGARQGDLFASGARAFLSWAANQTAAAGGVPDSRRIIIHYERS